jgi:hypothetical protein
VSNQTLLAVVVGFALVAIHWLLSSSLLAKLERDRPQLFDDLGRPVPFPWEDKQNSWPFWAWVFSARAHLEQGAVLAMVWCLRVVSAVFIVWLVWTGTGRPGL